MKTIKIKNDVHKRLMRYKFRLQVQRGETVTLGEAIDTLMDLAHVEK